MYTEASKNGNAQATEMLNSLKANMNSMMPGLTGNPYSSILNNYNNIYSQMMNAVSPFAKLMTPSNDTKGLQEWTKIINDMNVYNIKNAELQHMVYETGMKVMEKIAAATMHKIENGEEVSSMMKLYQDYLNTSDKMYVELFETDEYSKLMAEVSSLKMGLKKAVELQMEKSFVNIPLATRSEMDEVYQTIYDLKKLVRSLEAKLQTETPASKPTKTANTTTAKTKPVAKAAPKKAAGKRK
jgi:polyhydroxyalkanoate synthesis regulator phasin